MGPSVASMRQDPRQSWCESTPRWALPAATVRLADTDFMEEEMHENAPRLAGPGQVGLPENGRGR